MTEQRRARRVQLRFLLPLTYLAFALLAWTDFIARNPAPLANLGLMLVTLPVTVLGLVLTWASGETNFVLIPWGLSYDLAFAVYFWPSALLIALLLYWLGSRWDKKLEL